MTGLLWFGSSAEDIGSLKKNGDVGGLIRLLGHRDFETRWRAADALGTAGLAALDPLVAALTSRNIQIRLGAVEALGTIGEASVVAPLIRVLVLDESDEVRWAAVIALGEVGDQRALPHLVSALKDKNRYIRYGAACVLTQLHWQPDDESIKAYYFIALQKWDTVLDLGSSATGPLTAMLGDPDPVFRQQVVELLGRIGDPDAQKTCQNALSDREASVRWAAVLASEKCNVPTARLPVILALRERTGTNPAAAALLNFLFLGIGYNYLGKWWGFLVFMAYMSILVLAQLRLGPFVPYLLAFPITALFAVQTYFMAKRMADL
jgi:HEAT repeat protein